MSFHNQVLLCPTWIIFLSFWWLKKVKVFFDVLKFLGFFRIDVMDIPMKMNANLNDNKSHGKTIRNNLLSICLKEKSFRHLSLISYYNKQLTAAWHFLNWTIFMLFNTHHMERVCFSHLCTIPKAKSGSSKCEKINNNKNFPGEWTFLFSISNN